MEWYVRFEANKWLKAHNYQIKYVDNYIKYGIQPKDLTFTDYIKKDNTIYIVYLNEYGEKVEMLFDNPEKIAYMNRITVNF